MLNLLSEKIIKFRWIIIVFWILVVGVVLLKAPLLSDVAKGDQASFLPDSSDTTKASLLIQKLYPEKGTSSSLILTVFREEQLKEQDAAYGQALEEFLMKNKGTYKIREINSPFTQKKFAETMVSKNRKAANIQVHLTVPGYKDITNEAVRLLRDLVQKPEVAAQQGAPEVPFGLKIHVTGDAALGQETNDNVQNSMDLTAKITILLVLAVLIFIYRSPVAPLVPLFTIGIAFLISRGVVAELTYYGLKVSSFTETFMMAVLFGAGTDYCLLLASRYREEIVKGREPKEALKVALPSTWIAIVSSGATVIVGFFAMILAKFGLYSTTGPSIAIGVAITILAVVTLTPAIIVILGEKVFWPAQPSRNVEKEKKGSAFWNRLSVSVTGNPIRYIVISLIIFLPFMLFSFKITRSFDQLSDLPSNSDAKKGFEIIKENFNQGEMLPVTIVLDGKRDMWSSSSLAVVEKMAKTLSQMEGVEKVRTATRPLGEPIIKNDVFYLPPGVLEKNPLLKEGMQYYISPKGNGINIDVVLSVSPYTTEALDSAKVIKNTVKKELKGTMLENAEFYVTGTTAAFSELREVTAQDFTKVILFVLVGIFIVLILLLRSFIAPLYLILTIIFSYATTMGITYLVFQVFLGQIGLTWSVPFFSFCILVALGVDYNIFLMSRVKEEYSPGNMKRGVERALASTGRIITSCGIIMAGTFGALMASPVNQLVQIGFTAVVGLLLDTFVIRCLLVPAIAVKVGELNWWPGNKLRILSGKNGRQ